MALVAGAIVNIAALVLGEAVARIPPRTPERPPTSSSAGRTARTSGSAAWSRPAAVPVAVALAAPVARRRSSSCAGLVAAAGLLWYELGFIAAGQAVPIS